MDQFGVYMALKSAENFKNSNSKQYGNLVVVIYACEESTRFKTACLGSYYLSGELSYEKLKGLKDKNGITLEEAVSEYKGYIFSHLAEYGIDLNNIKLVDKVLNEKEISEAIEAHIEQSQILSESQKQIGIVDSIGKPLRGTIYVNGKNSIVTSAKIITALNELSMESKSENQEEVLRITVPEFNSIPNKSNLQVVVGNNDLLKIKAIGANDHSGATPIDKRKDAVLGLSKLILKLENLRKENPNLEISFLGSSTEKWGANQIQDNSDLILRIKPESLYGVINSFAEEITEETNVLFDVSEVEWEIVQNNSFSELFVDVRQQYPMAGDISRDKLYNIFKSIQEENNLETASIYFDISSKNTPVKTSNELLEEVKSICEIKKYPYQIMHSWPGHDLACVLSESNKTGKRILFFIPSEGGSHNPNETTSKEAILIGTDVYSTLVSQRMNKFEKMYERKDEEYR